LIRVSVAAQSPVIRAGLEAMLRADLGVEVIADSAGADVAVVYVQDADEFDQAIGEAGQAPAVLLADGVSSERIARALRSNIRALLPKDAGEREILAAVQAAAAGMIAMSPADVEKLLAHGPEAAGADPLTPRELEVLRMIAEGESNKRIAWRLGISEHTVKFHVASILTKMNASTRAEAVAIGIRRGLVYV
jgi:DNA-binding NarL/FixJ family response regulator